MPTIFSQLFDYLASPIITATILWFIFQKAYKLGKISKDFRASLNDIKDLKKDNKKLLNNTTIIKTHLVSKLGMDANLFTIGSPIKLKKKGTELLKISNFIQIYQKDKNWFIQEIKKSNPETLSAVDEASANLLNKMKNDLRFKNFQEIAFQHGITIDILLKICAIYLRNQIAKEIFPQ